MTTRFLAPDLSKLPPPALIEELSFEAILAEQKADLLARWNEVRQSRPDLPPLDTLGLESEPLTILLQTYAYRETLLRALVNDKARAVLLAFAQGADLDHIGADRGVARAVIDAAAGLYEADDRFRRRIQLAPEALSIAGPAGAYEFHALTLDPSIMDAYAWTPRPGEVHVAVVGNGIEPVSDAVLERLVRRFSLDGIVPLTDTVVVRRATVNNFDLHVTASISAGVDSASVRAAIEAAARGYMSTRARIGMPVYLSGLIAAMKTAAIENIIITAPASDVACEPPKIAKLVNVVVTTNTIG